MKTKKTILSAALIMASLLLAPLHAADNTALGDDTTNPGTNTTGGDRSTAVGHNNQAATDDSTALGSGNAASGSGATALGRDNTASSVSSIAVGSENEASGITSIAIGITNTSSNLFSTAVGNFNLAGVAYYEGESAVGINLKHSLSGEKAQAHGVYLSGGVSVTSQSTVLSRAVVGFKF